MAVQEHLRVAIRREADLAIVHLDGELDLASAPLFQSELEREEVRGQPRVLIDLRDLRFVDSTGLRAIFGAHSQALARGQQLAVTRGSEQVQRLLTITRVGEHLNLVDSPEQLDSTGA